MKRLQQLIILIRKVSSEPLPQLAPGGIFTLPDGHLLGKQHGRFQHYCGTLFQVAQMMALLEPGDHLQCCYKRAQRKTENELSKHCLLLALTAATPALSSGG